MDFVELVHCTRKKLIRVNDCGFPKYIKCESKSCGIKRNNCAIRNAGTGRSTDDDNRPTGQQTDDRNADANGRPKKTSLR